MADKLSERLERIARGQVWGVGDHETLDEAIELARRVEDDELEVAVAQAVEFAEYVERQAKGTMRDAAKRFLSLPYSQEIAAKLALARRVEGAEVGRLYAMAAGDWIVTPDEDGDVFQLYARVRLVPEPPEVGG